MDRGKVTPEMEIATIATTRKKLETLFKVAELFFMDKKKKCPRIYCCREITPSMKYSKKKIIAPYFNAHVWEKVFTST